MVDDEMVVEISTEKGILWKEAILAKYGMEDNWMTKNVITPYGCSVWRAIRNLWPKIQIRTKVRIGNGQKTSFGMTSGQGFEQ